MLKQYYLIFDKEERLFYTGDDFIHQGQKFGVFDIRRRKKYKTEYMANKVKDRLLMQCVNIEKDSLAIVEAVDSIDETGKRTTVFNYDFDIGF